MPCLLSSFLFLIISSIRYPSFGMVNRTRGLDDCPLYAWLLFALFIIICPPSAGQVSLQSGEPRKSIKIISHFPLSCETIRRSYSLRRVLGVPHIIGHRTLPHPFCASLLGCSSTTSKDSGASHSSCLADFTLAGGEGHVASLFFPTLS